MSESNARLLTTLLREAGAQTIDVDGQPRSRQEYLAAMAWDYLIEGEVTLPNGVKLTATPREWINALKWLFAQIDGKPPAQEPAPGSHPISAPPRVVIDETDDPGFDHDDADFRPVSASRPADGSEVAAELRPSTDFGILWTEAQPSEGLSPSGIRATDVGLQPSLPASPRPLQPALARSAQIEPLSQPPGRPPVPSVQADGRVILIDRDEYDRRREEGFRNGSRYIIGDPDGRFARLRW